MSAYEAPAVPAQPEGQGGDGENGLGLYDLSAAPDELRPLLEAELKKVEGNVTRKFQEHAEYRKRFEPLEQIPPDELTGLMEFRQLASDPEQFADWWTQVGESMGLLEPDGEDAIEGEEEGTDGLVQSITEQVMAALDQRLGPLEQRYVSQEQETRMQQATQQVESELSELQQQHGDFDQDAVCQLALAHEGPDAIRKGFEDYQRIIGNTERGMVEQKLAGPAGGGEAGGRPDTHPEPVTSFGDASRLALERLRGA